MYNVHVHVYQFNGYRLGVLFRRCQLKLSHSVPQAHAAHAEDRVARTTAFFRDLSERTARLVALWQSVGFCHG